MRFDLTSLEIFTAIAEEGSLTRAAQLKHIAVSAISKRISELEDQVGSQLLIRRARGVTLTPAGQSLLFYSRQLAQTLHLLENELSDYATGIKGHIRIHAITSVLSQFLPDDIARFTSIFPDVEFDIEERVGSAVVRAVVDGRADLGIIAAHTPSEGLQILPYRTDELTVVIPAGHALSRRKSVRFEEVLAYEFVGPHLESSMHSLLTEQAQMLKAELKLKIRISSFDCMCRLVSAKLGLAILPRSVILPFLKSHKIKAINLDEKWANRSLSLVLRRYDLASPTLKSLIDHLKMKD